MSAHIDICRQKGTRLALFGLASEMALNGVRRLEATIEDKSPRGFADITTEFRTQAELQRPQKKQ